jgi:hypothetical protein
MGIAGLLSDCFVGRSGHRCSLLMPAGSRPERIFAAIKRCLCCQQWPSIRQLLFGRIIAASETARE